MKRFIPWIISFVALAAYAEPSSIAPVANDVRQDDKVAVCESDCTKQLTDRQVTECSSDLAAVNTHVSTICNDDLLNQYSHCKARCQESAGSSSAVHPN